MLGPEAAMVEEKQEKMTTDSAMKKRKVGTKDEIQTMA
jgi:uncharacterized protein YdcH (DUF465 family)